LNSGDEDWSRSAQSRWSQDLAAQVKPTRSATNRLVHVNTLCTNLGWAMKQVPSMKGRRGQWKECANVPSGTATQTLHVQGTPYQAVFNYHGKFGTSLKSEHIKVFTDGSASLPAVLQDLSKDVIPPSSSWGVCYGDDWFTMCWHMIPPESQLAAHDVRGGKLVGDVIPPDFSEGIYMAELHAVVRALMSLPVTWKVTVTLDSKSSILAVDRYMTCASTRSKLRMPGRPMLGLIQRLVQDRTSHGGKVEWVHVKSHSDVMEENEAGNRCADRIAGGKGRAAGGQLQPLRLELGENWLYITQENGQVVYSDVRRAVLKRFMEINLELWTASPSQGAYAHADMQGLCSQVLGDAAADASTVKFLMCVASDTVQYVWIDDAAAGEKVQQRCCSTCVDEILDMKHVLTCPGKGSERNALWSEIVDLLKPHVSEYCVLRLLSAACLESGMRALFSSCAYEWRVLFGGFCTLQSYQMLHRMGVKSRAVMKELTVTLREMLFLRCLTWWKSLC
jgi:hypothetical protein